MSQLEVSHILRQLLRHLASRSFATLYLKTDFRAAKSAEELLREAARCLASSATRRSALEPYQTRGREGAGAARKAAGRAR